MELETKRRRRWGRKKRERERKTRKEKESINKNKKKNKVEKEKKRMKRKKETENEKGRRGVGIKSSTSRASLTTARRLLESNFQPLCLNSSLSLHFWLRISIFLKKNTPNRFSVPPKRDVNPRNKASNLSSEMVKWIIATATIRSFFYSSFSKNRIKNYL